MLAIKTADRFWSTLRNKKKSKVIFITMPERSKTGREIGAPELRKITG